MEFDDVAAAVAGVPLMSRARGREIYDHVRETKPEAVLEIGTHRGVSAAYIAAALEENGTGTLTTVDHVMTGGLGAPQLVERTGLDGRVSFVKVADSSYNWWLKKEVEARSDENGNVEPCFDFCFLDGAHHFTVDGLAVILVEKLLRPGGWLLLDDLDWTYEGRNRPKNAQTSEVSHPLSEEERTVPNVRGVYDVIVRQHPSLTVFREDGHWGWAQKRLGPGRRYEVERRGRSVSTLLRRVKRRASRILGG